VSNSVTSSGGFPELEKYELIEEIGHGGMATVYRARDVRLEREVAVKIIHKHLRENAEVRRRFVAEAKAVAMLRHPGIVEVYDVSDDDEIERYLVVELIRGMSLREMLSEHEMLPAEVAAGLVALLCDAAEHAHQSGVIHRDIKPENVLLELPGPNGSARDSDVTSRDSDDADDDKSRNDRRSDRPSSGQRSGRPRVVVKLADFGIAKLLDVQGVTSTGQILGSPAHMAPEQIEGGDIGSHTDVFALGVLLYECMVGHLPFEGRNPAQVLRRVLNGDFDPADAERAQVGGRWARVLECALDIDIGTRVGSAAEFGALIHEELEALGIEDVRSDLVSYFEDPDGYRQRQRDELVEVLLKRGEGERKQGRVQGAAADFNRALALRPDDLSILKRVSALSSRTMWRERGSKIAAIVASSLALGGATYGVTRLLATSETTRTGPDSPRSTLAPTASAPSASNSATPAPSATTQTSATPSASVSVAPRVVGPAPPAPSGDGAVRKVRFHVQPNSASFSLDGTPTPWLGNIMELPVGSAHSLHASMPPGNPCCEEYNGNVTIQPGEEGFPDAIQIVRVDLPIRPATVTLVNGPTNGLMQCDNGVTVKSGGRAASPMNGVEWRGSCRFSPGNKSRAVTFHAGQVNAVPWPP
jgi:serine/threonine protein kinase